MNSERKARLLGEIVQGLVIGSVLLYAVWSMAQEAGVLNVFRYEGF